MRSCWRWSSILATPIMNLRWSIDRSIRACGFRWLLNWFRSWTDPFVHSYCGFRWSPIWFRSRADGSDSWSMSTESIHDNPIPTMNRIIHGAAADRRCSSDADLHEPIDDACDRSAPKNPTIPIVRRTRSVHAINPIPNYILRLIYTATLLSMVRNWWWINWSIDRFNWWIDWFDRLDRSIACRCGQVQTGDLVEGVAPNGLLGLGPNDISIPNTLARNGLLPSASFSICFSSFDSSGRLVFGTQAKQGAKSTPLLSSRYVLILQSQSNYRARNRSCIICSCWCSSSVLLLILIIQLQECHSFDVVAVLMISAISMPDSLMRYSMRRSIRGWCAVHIWGSVKSIMCRLALIDSLMCRLTPIDLLMRWLTLIDLSMCRLTLIDLLMRQFMLIDSSMCRLMLFDSSMCD
jgi:hypothetical protein